MSNEKSGRLLSSHNWLAALLGIAGLVGLYGISRDNFLLFHCLAEAISVVIAIAVFAIFWNCRELLDNGFYIIVGLGCLFGGLFDLVYLFAYPGISVFPGADGNLALQAKTVAQWCVSLSCLAAFPFLRRKVDVNSVLLIFSLLVLLAVGALFHFRVFPACYREGVGFTAFERFGLTVSCVGYLIVLALCFVHRREFDNHVLPLIATVAIMFFLEDVASAVAVDINGPARVVAHLCQVVAVFFVYKAFVEVALRRPYALLLRGQQQSVKALDRQRQFLEAVLDHVQSGVIACDARGVLTVFNRALRELHGFSLEAVPPESWAQHFNLYRADGKTPLKMEEVPLYRALGGEHVRNVEMVIVSRDGTARTCLAGGQPLRGEDGLLHGAVVVIRDITERKQADEILKLTHDVELQRHQAELAHVARLSMLGETAASLAHELNQPLHAVKNYAYGSICRLRAMPSKDDELIAALEQIGEEASRAAEIIRRVRVFAQKREPRFCEVSVNRLVEETVLFSKMDLTRYHAAADLELAQNLPAVVGDPVQLQQVLMNLVRNGLEAMEHLPYNERRLDIETRLVAPGVVQVDLRDNGTGINPADLERMFEAFFTTKPEGMGLGLAISRSIVQSHGGRLWATVNETRGSTFHFTLPTGNRS